MSAERGIPRKRGAAHNCGLASRSSCFPSPCSSRSRRGSRAHTHACRGRADACEHAQAGLSEAAEAVRGAPTAARVAPRQTSSIGSIGRIAAKATGPRGGARARAGRADEAARRAGSSPAHPPPACRHSESAARPRRRRSSTGAAPSAGEANAPSRVTRGRAGGRSCVVAPGADPAILELLDNSQLSCHTSSDA